MTEVSEKKDVQKLQRIVVDSLEDVKAQDISVFNTEHLSPLFERVIIASGTSNRQTKALAASVRDAVREAGFPKPRVEGEGNGEWIIIDCGQAVVHVMQPSFRAYYHLEELWGEKPVRLKLGVAKPEAVKKAGVEPAKPATTLRRSNAAKIGVAEAFPSKAQIKKNLASKAAAAKKTAAKSAGAKRPVAKAPVVPLKKVIVKTSAQKPAAKSAAKPAAKRAPVRKG